MNIKSHLDSDANGEEKESHNDPKNSHTRTRGSSHFNNYTYIIENIKTEQCPLKNICPDKKECFKYHNLLERRRDPKVFLIKNNSACKFAFEDNKWINPQKCPKGEYCDFFHTRNELFYDKRNFRKLYDCYTEQEKGKCPYLSVCPYKHNIDISIREIFLPAAQLEILEKNFSVNFNLIKKLEKLKKELNENTKDIVKCVKCGNYLVDFLVVLKCMHNYCTACLEELKTGNSKNCIFNCLSKNSRSNKKFELDSEYFVKSLKENLDLRADLLSKKTEVILSFKKNLNLNEIDKVVVNDKEEENAIEKENEVIEEEEKMHEKIDKLFDSSKDKEDNKLDNSVTSVEMSQNAPDFGDNGREVNAVENIEDSYDFLEK